MALSRERKQELARRAETLATTDVVVGRVRDYLARTGLEPGDLAHRAGYSVVAVTMFLGGSYAQRAANDTNLRAALIDYMDSHPVDAPQIQVQSKVYDTEDLRLLRRYFHEALNRGRAYYVYGAPGTQKSFCLEHLVQRLNVEELRNERGRRAYYIYCRQNMGPLDTLKRICFAAGVRGVGSTDRLLRNLAFEFRHRRCLLVFDEAQHLKTDALEVVRELLDRPPHTGLLFAGSHDLKRTFQQLDMEQWNSRIYAGKPLPGLSLAEAEAIVAGELPSAKAEKVHKLIESARVRDPYQGKDHTYLSARKLFWRVQELQEQLAVRKQEATA